MIDLGTAALIVGAYVAVIGLYIWMDRRTTVISNHMDSKLDKIEKGLSDFKSNTNRSLGRIEGQLRTMNKGGEDGGEGGV